MLQRFLLFYFILIFASTNTFAQDGTCVSGNCQNGYGRFEWHSGEEYIGNFSNGKMNGYGVFYWQNKRKFIGGWKKGKMDGEGILFYENGQIKKGIWKANTFVRLLRNDFSLSRENIQHGEHELLQMLVDRPALADIVQKDDLIWQWVLYKLAGEDVQSPIYWQANSNKNFPIPTGVNAVHAYPTPKSEGRVWVADDITSEEMWAGIVYELHNIKNGPEFQKIERDAKYFACSRKDYIMRYARLEYKAAQETAIFYRTIWLPYCQSKGIKPQPQLWFYYLPDTFEKWAKGFNDPSSYPWHPYSGYYDQIVKDVVKNY
ncbi:hypothetical protein [Aureispira sp. CCB-E]|uniref:hypothetical protein n=1 Tax=Aureispira sp. CCB-E TaxID=3051121 RepID=UPI0028691C49|nr:hypothetical protein [Aureispira sp. CCB-E]WMX12065.1 hypothetical protein QP953_14655 [Aureispira sp. CCB-E]